MEAATRLVVFWILFLVGYVDAQVQFLYQSGNSSSSLKDFTLDGNAQVEPDGIHLEYSSGSRTQVFYHRSVASNIPLSFSSSITFSIEPGSTIYFQVVGLSYNFPYCPAVSIAPDIYNCSALNIEFESFTSGQVGVSLFTLENPLPQATSVFKLKASQPLTTWIDYHRPDKPSSVRVWMAEGKNSSRRPKAPVLDFHTAVAGSYFFPVILAASPGTSCVIRSWAFSSVALRT